MSLELRKSFIPAVGLASIVIVTLCYRIVRDTIDAASMPVQLAFSVLLIAAYAGMFQLLRLLLPLVLAKFLPTLDR
jgi:hypothetical protein